MRGMLLYCVTTHAPASTADVQLAVQSLGMHYSADVSLEDISHMWEAHYRVLAY